MSERRRERARWVLIVTFAAAMAWVEAACVYYLRVMVDRVEPYQPDPLPIRGILGEVELVREGATLLMLATTGILAGRTWRARLSYAAIAFGSWDILYYVFLRIISGWPASLFDWDILFLLPLPWWGPVLAPVCIASLMIGVFMPFVCAVLAGGRGGVSLTKGYFQSSQASDIPSLRPLSRRFSECDLNWVRRRNRRNPTEVFQWACLGVI